MNNENLIPNSKRSRKELQEMGRKGGIASGKSRREKAALKKTVNWMVSLPEFKKQIDDAFQIFGSPPKC